MLAYIDLFTVLLATFLALLFFYLWDFIVFKKIKKNFSWKFFFYDFPALFVVGYTLALIELFFHVTSFADGLIVGGILWIGIALPLGLISFKTQENRWVYFYLEELKFLIALLLMGSVIAG